MNPLYWLLPLIAALVGWAIASLGVWLLFHPVKPVSILGWRLQGVIPKRKAHFMKKLSQEAATLFSFEELQEKIVGPESFQKLLPSIEAHIDDFLNIKLGKAMPFLGAFIGEKTVRQLKDLFLEELAILFPDVMKKYFSDLQQESKIEGVLYDKLVAIPSERLEAAMKSLLASELAAIKWMGALAGLLIGLIQILMGWLLA